MFTISAQLTYYIAHSASLKDKRQVSRSLIDKLQKRFNASIAEVGTQDQHQTLTIGIAVISGDINHARHSLDKIIRFAEEHGDAELIEVGIV